MTVSTILVTGLSGAGRATALNALEDCGFHRVYNIPADLIPHLIENNLTERPLALGMGSRRTDREYRALMDVLKDERISNNMSLLFLEADDATILRRYNETRRVHPNAQGRDVLAAIHAERELLFDLKARADVIIDTSRLNPHQLRGEIKRQFNLEDAHKLIVTVESFSYKFGTPPSADMIFDCRFLKNPHWEPELRALTGQSELVQNYVKSDENFTKFHKDVRNMLSYILPAMQSEGRSYFNLAFGCTGGKHRSVTMAQIFSQELADQGYEVLLMNRELGNKEQK